MNEITTALSPVLNDRTLLKLRAFARPTRMTDQSGQFDIGYERCKQDLLELIDFETSQPRNAADRRWQPAAVVIDQRGEHQQARQSWLAGFFR